MSLARSKLSLLHIAKRDLALSDDDYRAILSRIAGVESAGDLTELGFHRVIGHFTELGFKSTWTRRTYGNRAGMASPAQVDLIRSLWRQYAGRDDDAGLNAWLARFHHVSALRFVSADKAGAVITALKRMADRSRSLAPKQNRR